MSHRTERGPPNALRLSPLNYDRSERQSPNIDRGVHHRTLRFLCSPLTRENKKSVLSHCDHRLFFYFDIFFCVGFVRSGIVSGVGIERDTGRKIEGQDRDRSGITQFYSHVFGSRKLAVIARIMQAGACPTLPLFTPSVALLIPRAYLTASPTVQVVRLAGKCFRISLLFQWNTGVLTRDVSDLASYVIMQQAVHSLSSLLRNCVVSLSLSPPCSILSHGLLERGRRPVILILVGTQQCQRTIFGIYNLGCRVSAKVKNHASIKTRGLKCIENSTTFARRGFISINEHRPDPRGIRREGRGTRSGPTPRRTVTAIAPGGCAEHAV
ncbi:hypothetical protein EVAR_53796_1 [Eumeta japonica]|uniref:Uncharacterized protein n=1 Tax=Eumeta variegata TaxID=151549 RepID=A0A4C1XXB2_EUMVA|nr:hypothetical protein EVAR_53796_1 [Eumeta japonica]